MLTAFGLVDPVVRRRELDSLLAMQRRSLSAPSDDLAREVYGLLGLPVDAIDFCGLLDAIKHVHNQGAPFLISTPNVNFLIRSQVDAAFRQSLLLSNLCLADGMPLIWLARLLRIPILERVAGADLFVRLKSTKILERRLRIFLLGGADGVAEAVGRQLNDESTGMECVGVLNPGFGSIDQMSTPQILDTINASSADLLAVFFGAEKAQAWLMRNHQGLTVPMRAQFGATINFEAGTVKRAPAFMRSTGFEWLWRIKEEPYLWRRYWNDGWSLIGMLMTSVLPLMLDDRLNRISNEFRVTSQEVDGTVLIGLSGAAIAHHAEQAIVQLRSALSRNKPMIIDISNLQHIDGRFFGLFLMVRKQLVERGQQLQFRGASKRLRRIFRLNRFEYLLSG